MVPLHSASVPYQQQHQHQHQYGGQYQSSSMAEPSTRAPSFQDMQQQTDQHQLHGAMSTNSRLQLLSNLTRSPSTQSSSSTPANYSQSGVPVQPLYQQYPHQHALQTQPSPNNMSSYYQDQSSLVSPSTYGNPSPDRSALGQRLLPPDTHDNGANSHILQPQTYWPNQASTTTTSTTFGIPDNTHTITRPASPALYDRARGTVVAAPTATMQLPHPHPTGSLATAAPAVSTGTGYYVRAAGTLRKFPG